MKEWGTGVLLALIISSVKRVVLTWSWEFRNSERRQAKQPNVAS